MNIKNTIIKHYKNFFDLHAKGIALDEDDNLNLDWAEDLVKNCFIPNVINWVATKDELPPLHKYVLLYKVDNDEHKVEFIHEFDLTTERYTRNWTHWALIKPPCL